MFLAAQCGKKDIKKYTSRLMPRKELGVEDLLRDHGR
jgi:hypothetical protein